MNFLRKYATKNIDRLLMIAFLALGAAALLLGWTKKEAPLVVEEQEAVQVDTMIPAGYLLIPIELSNGESLASLAGPYALIDLYAVSENGRKGVKVAAGVKLLKAPLNPDQFAVLMREEESTQLVQREGPFFAALKNPKDVKRPSALKVLKQTLRIHYGDGR